MHWNWDSNHLNATVRWTVACRQLDGGNTLISALRAEMQTSPFRCTNKKERALALSFLLASLTGWTRKGVTSAHTGAKNVRWTLFSPWESPSAFSCIRYGCKWKLNIWSFCVTDWTEPNLNFCPSPARAKMQTSPFRCTAARGLHNPSVSFADSSLYTREPLLLRNLCALIETRTRILI